MSRPRPSCSRPSTKSSTPGGCSPAWTASRDRSVSPLWSGDDCRSAMSGDELTGVVFPLSAEGRRSSTSLGRAVVADALGRVDPVAALDAGRETDWRAGYLAHFRRLIEAGLASRQAAVTVACDGLESVHRRMLVAGPDGAET